MMRSGSGVSIRSGLVVQFVVQWFMSMTHRDSAVSACNSKRYAIFTELSKFRNPFNVNLVYCTFSLLNTVDISKKKKIDTVSQDSQSRGWLVLNRSRDIYSTVQIITFGLFSAKMSITDNDGQPKVWKLQIIPPKTAACEIHAEGCFRL